MTQQHTPGPWHVYDHTLAVVGPEEDGILVATATHLRGAEAPANARLIAGSPAMYKHVLWVTRLFGTDNPRGKQELAEHVQALRRIVADVQGD